MGFLVLLIIIVFFIAVIFINIKISNLKYRAKQHILKDTEFSSSSINANIQDSFEKKYLQKLLIEHQNFTEESIKEILKGYTNQIFNRNPINEFTQEVCEKIQKDSKLEKMQNMEFRRVSINSYYNSTLIASVVYTDNKDEYNVYLTCNILGDKIQLEKYKISKGTVIGF